MHLLLSALHVGSQAEKAALDICAVYGVAAITERIARDCYDKFRNGTFALKVASRSGRPEEFDEERLKQHLYENWRQTTRELAETAEGFRAAIEKYFQSMRNVRKCGGSVSQAIADNNRNLKDTIAAGLLLRPCSPHGRKK
ncbi:unnamed protein product [Dicrocoelium dendriticum]|nr:unnamed protein product [Dicrocoelium dendriticum]